jgi:hypothetical protein
MSGFVGSALLLTVGCTITHKTSGKPLDSDDAGPDATVSEVRDSSTRDSSNQQPVMDSGRDSSAAPDADDVIDEDDGGASAVLEVPCDEQIADSLDGLPDDIACIGLYNDVISKSIAPRVRNFTPGAVLWSDGAGKQRWVLLPAGEKIDATDPNNWVFPLGTKFFKEFRVDGRRIETRIYMKTYEDRWARGTYEWNRNESGARRSQGTDREDVLIAGTQYHIPSARECEQCHGGRKDRILGFEAVALGLPGAQGITLQDLVDEDLISPKPTRRQLSIGDDGTGHAGEVLTYVHMNCGVCCHNTNQNADAYSSDLFMKLDVLELDGRPVNNFEPWRLLVDQTAKTTRWGERKRVAPGSPEESLLYQLITSRAGPKEQMPPIATKVVDGYHTELIADWIRALPSD